MIIQTVAYALGFEKTFAGLEESYVPSICNSAIKPVRLLVPSYVGVDFSVAGFFLEVGKEWQRVPNTWEGWLIAAAISEVAPPFMFDAPRYQEPPYMFSLLVKNRSNFTRAFSAVIFGG